MPYQKSDNVAGLKRRLAEAEQALLESEQRFKAISETNPIPIGISEANGTFVYINKSYEHIFGYSLEEINQVKAGDLYFDSNDRLKWLGTISEKGILQDYEVRLKRKDGTPFWALISVAPIQYAGKQAFVGSVVDISESRQSYDEIRQLNCTLTALSNSNQAMLHATDEEEFLNQVCHIIVQDCGFAMAWIGYAEDNKKKSVRPVASAGFKRGYLEQLNITWANTARGRGPTGTAIRTKKLARCNNMLTDPKFAPWREAALKRGYASSLVLPLISGDRAFGALNIYSREPGGFSKAEEKLLTELTNDLSYGIMTLRLRKNNERAVESLRLSEERYHSLFDNMTEGFALHEMVCDDNGTPCDYRFIDLNLSFERLTGLKRDQVIGRLATQVLPGIESFWFDTYSKVVLTGQPVQFDNYAKTLGRFYRVYAYRPTPGQFAVIFSDITENKHIENRLEYLASFPENNPSPVVEADMDGKITYANPAALKLFPDLLAAEPIRPWLGEWTDINQFFRQGQASVMMRDLAIGDQIYQQYLNFMAQQGLIRIYSFDVTAQRKAEAALRTSEERFRTIVETAAEGIIMAQPDGKYTYVNQQMAKLLGYTVDEMLGKTGSDFMYDDQQSDIQSMRRELHRGEILHGEFGLRRKDGSLLWSMFTASPIFNDQGKHIANISMHTDVTERKLAEEGLHRAHNELERRIQERTLDLNIANSQLRAEIAEREKAQTELQSSLLELQVVEEELRNNNDMLIDAQKVLEEERKRYQDLFDFAPDAYLVTDKYGLIIEANQYASILLEVQHQNLIGKPLIVFIERSDHDPFKHLLVRLNNQKSIQSLELKLLPRRGPVLTASVKVARAEGQRKKYTLRWTIRDISHRKQAEETIRQNSLRNAVLSDVSQSLAGASLDEQAILNMVVTTISRQVGDGCVITLDSADGQWFEAVAWYHPKPEARVVMSSIFSSARYPIETGSSYQILQSSQSILVVSLPDSDLQKSISHTFQQYIDEVGISSLLVVPIQVGGKVIGTLGITRDKDGKPYTEDDQSMLEILANRTGQAIHNARLYHELQESLKKEMEVHDQLVQSEKFAVVGRLLASITHEINNPLQTIKNCLYLSQMDVPTGTPASEALNIATAETNRLSNLVAQLREIYRPPAHGLSHPVDLLKLVSEVQVLLASYLLDKHIQWDVTPPDEELYSYLKVDAVPDQLKQVFLNICLNAIDAMEAQGGKLMIDFRISAADNMVGIRFKDTGPGLPPQVKEKLFEPFISTKEKGLGLGLVICYDIIQKHTGRIDVESEPGQGAAFTVWLPGKKD